MRQVQWAEENEIKLGAFRQVDFLTVAGGRRKSRGPARCPAYRRSHAPVRGCSGSGTQGRTGSGFDLLCALPGPRLDFTFLVFSWADTEITGDAEDFCHDRQTAVVRVDVVESQPYARACCYSATLNPADVPAYFAPGART